MVKRLIFDFDNTLIIWKDKYLFILEKLVKKYKLDCDIAKLNYAIGESNSYINRGMTVENIIKQAKEICDVDISIEFVNEWFNDLGKNTIELEDDIKDTLEYLKDKYSMVVLSNFNGMVQYERAKSAGINHYFESIYGSDTVDMKPNPNSYKKAAGHYTIEECIMIGDNLKEDIEGSLKIGMKAIHLDRKNNSIINDNYLAIHKFSELKKIL